MKKLIKIICILILLLSAFYLGKYKGARAVIIGQNIWKEGKYFYSEYNGQVHEYEYE